MAGEVGLTRLLLGLGLTNLSMHPAHLLAIKQRVLTTEVAQAKAHVERIKRTDDPARLAVLLERLNA
jgi:phosphotransferase system enzyme I (PtsI)